MEESSESQPQAPMIFLAGPPGSGKTTLGTRACERLGLAFLDLSPPPRGTIVPNDPRAEEEAFQRAATRRQAEVVALPWALQQRGQALQRARQAGMLLLLWAHPQDMQQRSGRTAPLFTPVGRLKTGGGFGRQGTGCREFRSLDRACAETLLLVGKPVDEAAETLAELIEVIREEAAAPPAVREGLMRWVEIWREDCDADRRAGEVLVDAMARYTLHLKAEGKSRRTLSGVYSDLNAAGLMVMSYDAPKGDEVLDSFDCVPYEYEFRRKISDSANAVARYERTMEGFARFLETSGLIAKRR